MHGQWSTTPKLLFWVASQPFSVFAPAHPEGCGITVLFVCFYTPWLQVVCFFLDTLPTYSKVKLSCSYWWRGLRNITEVRSTEWKAKLLTSPIHDFPNNNYHIHLIEILPHHLPINLKQDVRKPPHHFWYSATPLDLGSATSAAKPSKLWHSKTIAYIRATNVSISSERSSLLDGHYLICRNASILARKLASHGLRIERGQIDNANPFRMRIETSAY